jgi:hypothetical protein
MNHYKLYRILSFCLLLNNLVGIILNLELTVASIIFFGVGIPGIMLLFFFLSWSFSPKQRNSLYYISISFFILIYNIFICYLMNEFGVHKDLFICFYPYIFPIINICLGSIICILSLAESSMDPLALEWPYPVPRSLTKPAVVPKPLTEPTKSILTFLVAVSVFIILIIILSLNLF